MAGRALWIAVAEKFQKVEGALERAGNGRLYAECEPASKQAKLGKPGEAFHGEAVERYLHRHRVKPGITGWAQVSGLRGDGRYARKGARSGRGRSLLHRALVPLARSEDPPEDGGKFLPRVTTHTDICMIHFPAEMSRYRFAPECPEL